MSLKMSQSFISYCVGRVNVIIANLQKKTSEASGDGACFLTVEVNINLPVPVCL